MKLLVRTGPSAGNEWTIVEANSTIGRDPSCDFVLPDEALSREHCRLLRDADGWTLIDMGSTNGIRVNGELLREARVLKHGDLIAMGQIILAVETDPAHPLPRLIAPAAPADKDPWLFGMLVFAAALIVVALSLFYSMRPTGTGSELVVMAPSRPAPVAGAPSTEALNTEPLVIDTNRQASLPTATLPASTRTTLPASPQADAAIATPPASTNFAATAAAPASTEADAALCPDCQQAAALVSLLPITNIPAAALVAAAVEPIPERLPPAPVEAPIVSAAPQLEELLPQPELERDTLAIEHLLDFSPDIPLPRDDAARVVRFFDRAWNQGLLDYPQLNRDSEIPRHRRLKSRALRVAIQQIAELESSASLTLELPNSSDCWQPEELPSPPVMSDWVPTKGLQGSARVQHDGLEYRLQVKHEVKGYDYGYYEPGRHLIYRLTVSLNDEVMLQKVYDLRSLPQAKTAATLGPNDLPSQVQRSPANSLMRYYAEDCDRILAPLASVTASANRDPIPANFVSRIPAEMWQHRSLVLNWRHQTGAAKWQRLVDEAVNETLSREFNGLVAD